MDFTWYGRRQHDVLPPRRLIYFGLEAAQDLMVTIRDLRRTVRLLQSGFTTLFPDEAIGLHLHYGCLDRDLMQVERTTRQITTQLLTAVASTDNDIVELAAINSPAIRGVWLNRVYVLPCRGSLTDQSGRVPIPLDVIAFRLTVRTVHINAYLGGFLDLSAMPFTVDDLVNLAYELLCITRPPRLRGWTEFLQETDLHVRPTLLNTSLQTIFQGIIPLVRLQILIQDPPNAATSDPTRELQWPEICLV